MNYKNLTLQTINNTLHIKADNLEPIEVDSSCESELLEIVLILKRENKKFDEIPNAFNLRNGIQLPQELADRIEVRDEKILLAKSGGYKKYSTIEPPTFIEDKPYYIKKRAFLLPSKEDSELQECLEIVDKKSYTIEEIEMALNKTSICHYDKLEVINNLKK